MKHKYVIKIFICHSLNTIFFIGCSSNSLLNKCDELLKFDKVEYYVPGLMDHTELEKKWIKYEVDKNNIKAWIADYIVNKHQYKEDSSTINLTENERQSIDYYYGEWQHIENKLALEDRVFYYTTPEEYWDVLAGQDGLVVIRNCKIYYVLVISQS